MKHGTWKFVIVGLLLTGAGAVAGAFAKPPRPAKDPGKDPGEGPVDLARSSKVPSMLGAARSSGTLGFASSDAFAGECDDPSCVWELAEFAHCPALVDPELITETLQIRVDWHPNGEGHDPEVTVTSGCYDESSCSDVQRPLCVDGQTPVEHPDIADCIFAKVVVHGPPDLAIGEYWGIVQHVDPAGPDEPGDEPEPSPLPLASEGAAELGPLEAISTLKLPGTKPDASLSIFECGRYGCAFTSGAREVLDEVLATRPQVDLRWLNFPGEQDSRSQLLARAAIAAHEQGAFWQLHDALFDAAIDDEADLLTLAEELGLDPAQFSSDLADPATTQRIADQRAFCLAQGVRATPSFVIDGELVTGVRTADELGALIDVALAE